MRNTKISFIGLCFGVICVGICTADLSWAATTIYGPKKFLRNTGKPIMATETFPAPSLTADYKLAVLNGEKGQYRTSSATIRINGTEVLSERDFNQQVDRMGRGISLQAFNSLSVELRSVPGSFLTIVTECLDCIDITILSPKNAETVNSSKVLIKGTIMTTTEDVGVMVNGWPAQINGLNWAILMPLSEGSNTITAKVTDSYGSSAEKSINPHLRETVS